MDRIHVRLDHQLKERLESAARAGGVTPSDVVREAVRAHLAKKLPRENCLALARRIGVVGIYTNVPSDLSTNPAHREGFGSD